MYHTGMDVQKDLATALEANREALQREISALQASITQDTRRLADLQMKLESVLALMRLQDIDSSGPSSGRHFVEEAYDLLLESGPLHYTRLADALRDRQVFVPGLRPEMNLLTHMNRDARFERVDRGTYRAVVEQPDGTSRKTRNTRGRRAA